MSYADQVSFYNKIFTEYPDQKKFNLQAMNKFLDLLSGDIAVAELGGWNGELAANAISKCPRITKWVNYEICESVIDKSVCKNDKYRAIVMHDFVWNAGEIEKGNTFVASHVIEHIKTRDLMLLLNKMKHVTHMYLEAPIGESAVNHDWSGYLGTHILEIGWAQIASILNGLGFSILLIDKDVRCFKKACAS